MGCCGSQRQAYAAPPMQRRRAAVMAAPAPSQPPARSPATPSAPAVQGELYEYRGSSALNVVNPGTGRRYVFAAPGARLRADPADSTWLDGFPWLARVA